MLNIQNIKCFSPHKVGKVESKMSLKCVSCWVLEINPNKFRFYLCIFAKVCFSVQAIRQNLVYRKFINFIFMVFFQRSSFPNIKYFPVWLRNRLLSAGLELVLGQIEKSCIVSNYRQFSTNIKIKIIKLIPDFLARVFGSSVLKNWL